MYNTILMILTYLSMIFIIACLISIVSPNVGFLMCMNYSMILFIANRLINNTINRIDFLKKESKRYQNK